ncbi:MAG: ABC transporter permease [Myxococcales bacterium]|jgi:spermidine/putrescine transport system permease protein
MAAPDVPLGDRSRGTRLATRFRTRETRERWLSVAQLSPATLFLLVFLAGPLIVFLIYSFWVTRSYQLVSDWTFANYREALSQKVYRDLFRNTLEIAVITAAITTSVAYVYAHLIRFQLRRFASVLLFVAIVALFSGYLVRIYAWRTILGDEGIINHALQSLGVVDQPLSFLLYSRAAALIVLVNFLVPLAILPIYASLQNVSDDEIEAARDLGAGSFQAFRKVTLPLAWNGIFAAFSFTFIIAAGDYVTPQLVGGTSGAMIGRAIADKFGVTFAWPLGAALSFLTLVFVLAILGIVRVGARRLLR